MAVGPARRAAPVDGGASAVQVDHQPPPTQIVAALAQFDIADHGDQPPVEVVNGDIALRHFVALGHHHPARRVDPVDVGAAAARSEEHTSELQSLMRISYAVFCLKKKKYKQKHKQENKS